MDNIAPRKWKPIYSKVVLYSQQSLPELIITKRTGLCAQALNNIRQMPEYHRRLAEVCKRIEEKTIDKLSEKEADYIAQAKALLTKNTVKAAKIVIAFTKKGNSRDRIKLDAALQILDRCNIKGKEIIETQTRPLSPEELTSAKSTLLELETITQRVSQTQSRFVLHKPATSSVTDKVSHDPIPADAQNPPSLLGEVEPTGQDRSDLEPAQPILPV